MSRDSMGLAGVVRLVIALLLVAGVVWNRVDPAGAAALTWAVNALTKR